MKKTIFLLGLLAASPITSYAANGQALDDLTFEDYSISVSYRYSEPSIDWSIDNSKSGGSSKASELKWKAKVNNLDFSLNNKFNEYYLSIGKSSDGSMNDSDWDIDGDLWSDTISNVNYQQITLGRKNKFMYGFMDMELSDSYLISDIYFKYEDWKADGLEDLLYGGNSYDGVNVNHSSKYSLGYSLGMGVSKDTGTFVHKINGSLVMGGEYFVDRHPLREDLDTDKSFYYISPFAGVSVDYSVSYKLSSDSSLSFKTGYYYSRVISNSLQWRDSDGNDYSTGLGFSESSEFSVGLMYKVKL